MFEEILLVVVVAVLVLGLVVGLVAGSRRGRRRDDATDTDAAASRPAAGTDVIEAPEAP